jgi:hypothetical protein
MVEAIRDQWAIAVAVVAAVGLFVWLVLTRRRSGR